MTRIFSHEHLGITMKTLYLSSLSTVPQYKPLPWYKRLLSWLIPFQRNHVVVSNGTRCYTHPLNLLIVRKILESNGYQVVLRANLTTTGDNK